MKRSDAPLVLVDQLSVRFSHDSSAVVDRISFEVHAGECVALVGESGSGKSLTAKALLGLLPSNAIRSGEILLDGTAAPSNGASAWNAIRGRTSGLVPQDALGALDPLRRIEFEVGDSLRLHRLAPKPARRELVVEALTAAGMPEPQRQLHRRSDELSGGLRQRALVASALIANPEIIIADEPTTALDAGHRGRVLGELRQRVDLGSAALLISHDLGSVRGIADRVLVMRDGRIVEQGPPEQVLTSPRHSFTRELVQASPAGRPRGERLLQQSTPAVQRDHSAPAPNADTPPRLRLVDVCAGFRSRDTTRRVLNNVDLEVHSGETVGLVGESGSGKTTLLRVALGLHAPESGRVQIDGVDRSTATRSARIAMRRRIALVPQDPLDTFPRAITGAALLADALRAAGVARADRALRSRELASEVGLEHDLLARTAATLSGGQRQRLAIARALAREPELLLLDEPVSALDVTVQARVLDLLDDIQERHATAYLFVSHDADVIAHMSDRVLHLRAGALTPL